MPKWSTPALLLTMVRFLVPLRRAAAFRVSGMSHRPKPPIRMVAPSWRFSMAASAEEMRLSTKRSEGASRVYCNPSGGQERAVEKAAAGRGKPLPYRGTGDGHNMTGRKAIGHKVIVNRKVTPPPRFFVSIHSKAI